LGGLHLAVKEDTIVVAGGTEDTLSFFRWDTSASTLSALSYQGSVKDGERLSSDSVAVDGLANVRAAMWSSDMANLYTISRLDKAVAVFASDDSLVAKSPCSSSDHSEGKSTTTQAATSFEPTTSFESADASESSDVLAEQTANAVEDVRRRQLTVWLIIIFLSCRV
jgi:hypothetical protein